MAAAMATATERRGRTSNRLRRQRSRLHGTKAISRCSTASHAGNVFRFLGHEAGLMVMDVPRISVMGSNMRTFSISIVMIVGALAAPATVLGQASNERPAPAAAAVAASSPGVVVPGDYV